MIKTDNADQNKFSILFYGTPDIARDILSFILKDSRFEVKLVITQPDTIAGRGKKLQAPQVKELALENQLPVMQPINIKKNKSMLVDVNKYGPFDIAIVVAYGQIIPESILNLPKAGSLNIHVSLLPRWRGAAPIQHAILAGDRETGVCLMKMDAGLDTGAAIYQTKFQLNGDETTASLHDVLAEAGAKALIHVLDVEKTKAMPRVAQGEENVTYANKITKEEAKINWSLSASVLSSKIRAFNPWPICCSR